MRFNNWLLQRRGVLLIALGCISSVWLTLTNQLKLYIHPRYIIFTAVMAGIGLILSVLSFSHRTSDITPPAQHKVSFVAILLAIAGVCLLIIKPASLTTATVGQRGINAGATTSLQTSNVVPLFGGGDYSQLGIKDWSGLLSQTDVPSFFANKAVAITGFVSTTTNNDPSVFYVSRFVITCCAVDARPIGVPVYLPNWSSVHKTDTWLQVRGIFVANPNTKSSQKVVVKPTAVTSVAEPKDPYVY